MTDYKTSLKELLPEEQKGFDPLDQYLDAAGEHFDGISGAIDAITTYKDYLNVSDQLLETLAAEFNIQYPRNLRTLSKRQLIRDAVKVFRSKGTERALKFVFTIIGWRVNIQYCWYLTEEAVNFFGVRYDGTVDYLEDNLVFYSDFQIANPIDPLTGFAYGNEKVYDNGVYADLVNGSGVSFNKYTIKGEYYDERKSFPADLVLKTPYIKIDISSDDYNIFTDDFVDENGSVFSYTDSERFILAQELITQLLDESRPANVAILSISTPFGLEDIITYGDPLDFDNGYDTVQSNTGLKFNGTASFGTVVDRYIPQEFHSDFEFGTNNMGFNSPAESFTISYEAGTSGIQYHIPTRMIGTTLRVTAIQGAQVVVEYSSSPREDATKGTATYEPLISLSNVTAAPVSVPNNTTSIRINIIQASTSTPIDILVNYI